MQLETRASGRRKLSGKAIGGTLLAILMVAAGLTYKYAALPKSLAYSCFREVSRESMAIRTTNWDSLAGKHFVVRYREQDKDVARLVLDTSEQSFEPVNKILGYEPAQNVMVLVYPSREELGSSFGWDANQSAMGVYWAGVIRVLSPRDWIDDTDPAGMEKVFQESGPMVHEYTHLVVDYMTRGNYPRWLTEGIAQYVERKITGFTVSDDADLSAYDWYPLASIDKNFDTPDGQSRAYCQSLAMTDYLVDRFGEGSLKAILTRLGTGETINRVWQEELGITLPQFEQDFHAWAANTPSN